MRQILFVIPLSGINASLPDIPIYGYGLMLFFAYLFCTALGKRLCKRQGLDGSLIPDLTIWLFVAGILGGRIVFVVQYWEQFRRTDGEMDFVRMLKLWDGGLVLYGALLGGVIGYFAYDYFVLRRFVLSRWKMLDVVAPCIALGVALGRIGCLCTGCCYGNVACEHSPPLSFPAHSMAWDKMVKNGNQSFYGYVLVEGTSLVEAVEPGSAAADAGLRPGDRIIAMNDVALAELDKVNLVALKDGELTLTVLRDGRGIDVTFAPKTIGLNPTQIYETISMCLLLFLLLSYFPFRRHEGELLVFFMVGYGVHRFLNEMLRTDTDPVAFGLTLSQNISIAVLCSAAVLAYFVWSRPPISDEPAPLPPAPVVVDGTTTGAGNPPPDSTGIPGETK
jgi:phosphatidylglycerol:prolipoprotein diacylglycerol transferase